jgi:2-oxoglutarate ferredoxin oxidoreductase subunit delta
MAKAQGAITVDIEKCKGCGLCVVSCPTNVIALAREVNGKGYNYAFMEKTNECIACQACGLVCPDSIIEVYRYKPVS